VSWVGWRLQRTETLVAFGILALLAAFLVPTGLHMASVYDHNGLATCIGNNTSTCSNAVESFTGRFQRLADVLGWVNLIPGLIGVLLAAPLLLDLENGTYRLAWTQSITRRRWLAGKLGLSIAAALLAALAIVVLMTWWRAPFDHLHGRMDRIAFDLEGTAPFGYILFALGLTLAVGVLTRRTVPALIVGFAGYVVAHLAIEGWVRQHYRPPLTATWPAKQDGPDLSHAWLLFERPSDKLGHPLHFSLALRDCISPTLRRIGAIDYACLAHKGAGYTHAVFQPAGRFWEFQAIETALFGGVAILLILFAAWWIHNRVA
jgi:hypothetical protein